MRLHDLPSSVTALSGTTPASAVRFALAGLLALSLSACSGSPTSPDRDPNSGGLTQNPTGSTAPFTGSTPDSGSLTKSITLSVITSMPSADDFVAGQILVRFNSGTPQEAIASLHARLGGTFDSLIYGSDVQIVTVPVGQELAIIDAYNREPAVDYAEPDHKYAALFTPNDTSFASKQWDMTKINCQQAWDVTQGLATIKVAVLDTGIDSGHSDLASKVVLGKNFSSTSTSFQDGHGHGTHCAGTVAAITNNAKGVAGVGFNTSLMVGKVLSNSGSGSTSWITSGINWA